MNITKWLLCVALVLSAGPVLAEGTHLPPIHDAATIKECSACHIALPPQLLPARSWQAIMGNLGTHFGESASLGDAERKSITAYLTAHAADGPSTQGGGVYIKGIAANAVPLRITETPYWQRRHSKISPADFKAPQVKSAANCAACHKGAEKGIFVEPEED